MGRTEAKSGQAAKRPMAATWGASLPRDVSVFSIVADLEGRDLDGLRRQWRAHNSGDATRASKTLLPGMRGTQRS